MTPRARNNRMVYALLTEARLTHRDDRLLLAKAILGREVPSMTDLSDSEMRDLAVALGDWRTVESARKHTGAYTLDSLQHLLNLDIPAELRAALLGFTTSLGLAYSDGGDEATITNPDEKEI